MILSLLMFFPVLITVHAQESLKVGRFFNPPNTDADDPGYANDPVWTVGETKTIQFTTTYSNYTIALWQQQLAGGSATLGPIIFRASSKHVHRFGLIADCILATETSTGTVTQFDWSVQLFEFDLKISNVFFLWLHPGDASDQGSGEDLSVTSHYVNFTSSVSSSSPTPTSTPSPKTSLSSTSHTSTQTSETLSATSIGSFLQTATSTAISGSTSDGGLSTGAEAGIGVGASLVGLAAVAGCGALIWHLRKKSSTSHEATYEIDPNLKSEAPQGTVWGLKETKRPASHTAYSIAELPGQSRVELG